MPRNNSTKMGIERRRRAVAALRLRHLTQREIVDALAKQGFRNPNTEKPYELGTVNSDLKALEAEWRASALGDITQHKGNHVAELTEVRRKAWQDNKLFYVLKSLEQEARVLGLEATEKDPTDDILKYLDLVDKATSDVEDMSE